nr:elongation of very long chain fatty acids 2/5 protein [Namalycastis rhodochorde]
MISAIKELYNYYEQSLQYTDPHSRDWFFVQQNPLYVIILTILYLGFVWLGPKWMRHRQPFKLQSFMVVYNLGLVFLSIYMVIEMWLSMGAIGVEGLGCAPYNEETKKHPQARRVAAVMWWYFFSKAIEFMDTVLMVLRKKNNQITFLHVFHHATMLNIWWWVVIFIPGGCSWFGACLNSLIHVFMYTYYGLSAIPSLREKLWWKKYLTRMQLMQFLITLTQTMYVILVPCDFPFWGKGLLAGYMVVMFTLFSNFYIQTYMKSRSRAKQAKLTNGNMSSNGYTNGYASHSNGKKHE